MVAGSNPAGRAINIVKETQMSPSNFSIRKFLIGVAIGIAISVPVIAEAQHGNQGGNWNNGNVNRPPQGGNWNRPPQNNWNGNWNRNNWNGNRTNWNVNINAGWWGVGVNNGWGWNNGWVNPGCCWGPTWVAPPIIYQQSAPVIYIRPSIDQQLFQIDVLLRQGSISPEQAAIARANILNNQ